MAPQPIQTLYQPNHDEASRQAFVAALKGVVNGSMEKELAKLYERNIEGAFKADHWRAPKDRSEATPLFEAEHLYQLWGSLTYTSQDLLWETVGETTDRQRTDFETRLRNLPNAAERLGSIELNESLDTPEPINSLEIHRQPGGYFYSADDHDLTSPLLYFSSIELYRKAKGLSSGAKTGEPGMGRFMIKTLREKFGEFQPKRILDMGCAVGIETLALKEAFPDAEVHGIDLSGPFVRFAHLWAEENGVAAHYKQANAADTGYPDGHFDLIVSHILFHETWSDVMPAIMKEAHRLLAKDGIFFNADIPYQPHRISIPKQVTNGWQVHYNGEPFWTGFADSDVKDCLERAGFVGSSQFAEYVPLGAGDYFFFGGQKA